MGTATYRKVILWCFVAFWVLLALNPTHRFDWFLENILVFASLTFMYFMHRRRPFSHPAYLMIFIFLLFHTIGAHYTYSEVPLAATLSKAIGWERNHYDRLVHFLFGLLLTRPVYEMLSPRISTTLAMKYFLTFCVMLTCGLIYELLEWCTALVVAPDAGNAFLGSQGDPWDAQKDLALKLAGVALAGLYSQMTSSKATKVTIAL